MFNELSSCGAKLSAALLDLVWISELPTEDQFP